MDNLAMAKWTWNKLESLKAIVEELIVTMLPENLELTYKALKANPQKKTLEEFHKLMGIEM